MGDEPGRGERGKTGLRGVAGALLGSLLAGPALVLLQASPAAALTVWVDVTPGSITEGASGTRMMKFYISGGCSGGSSKDYCPPPVANYWTGPDKPGGLVAPATTLATEGTDYRHVEGQATYGGSRYEVSVPIIGDTLFENNETFRLYVGTESKFAVGTIVEDDVTTAVRIGDATVSEGHTGTTTSATFTITRSGPKTSTSTVRWATADDRVAPYAATAGLDYQANSGTATFAPNATTATITVTVIGDLQRETGNTVLGPGGEEFHVLLSSPTGTIILDGTGLGRILDDDPLQGVRVNDSSVTEGNAGTTEMKFTITRYGENNFVQPVNWFATSPVGSQPVPGTDYLAGEGTVEFGVTETSTTFSVLVYGDTAVEPNERLDVFITTAAPGTILKDGDRARGTIVDDDTGLSIDDVKVTEGNTGTTSATFTIVRVGPTTGYSSVTWGTDNGTALAGSDYLSAGDIAYFAPGETMKKVSVTVLGETVAELNETFVVRLSDPVGAAITRATGTLTITDDDSVLTIDDVSVREGASGTTTQATFTITRTGPSTNSASVKWSTAPVGSTTARVDYKHGSGTATIPAGSSSTSVSVTVYGDSALEPDDQFEVRLSAPPVGINVIADGIGVGTILNDD